MKFEYPWDDVKRFLSRLTTVDGCILFRGALTPGGYGSITFQGRTQKAHRVAWMLVNGPIPDGMTVDHTCGVHVCVNPEHLGLIAHNENVSNGNRNRRVLHVSTAPKQFEHLIPWLRINNETDAQLELFNTTAKETQ